MVPENANKPRGEEEENHKQHKGDHVRGLHGIGARSVDRHGIGFLYAGQASGNQAGYEGKKQGHAALQLRLPCFVAGAAPWMVTHNFGGSVARRQGD